jgi:pimeloyl-ACP methyl ester carboxylesterase
MWMRDVAAWSAQFRVLAVDVIGEPGLSAPARPPLRSAGHAEWLDDVLQALGIARASFVGVSFGGWIALDYAIRRSGRVERLALINPAGVGAQRLRFLLTAMPLLFLGRWGRRRAMRLALGPRATAPATAEQRELFGFASLVFKHFRPRMGRLPRFSDAELARLTMPLLLVAGAQDALLDAHQTRRRLEQAAPQLALRFLADAGHFVPGETAPILEFLCARAASATAG